MDNKQSLKLSFGRKRKMAFSFNPHFNYKQKKTGFTLVELLVVVAIMGLLAALAIVALGSSRARTRDTRRIADMKQMHTTLELFFLDQQNYPTDDDSIGSGMSIESKCVDEDGITSACDADGTTYMVLAPSNPSPRNDGICADTPYIYYSDNSQASYHIVYCLGAARGDIGAGSHNVTPAGIVDD